MEATHAPSRRARFVEGLLVGGVTLALFPLSWAARAAFGRDPAEDAIDALAYHAAVFVNNPHFAVTYLLFYRGFGERALGRTLPPAQRARYIVAGALVPLALLAWAGLALSRGSATWLGLLVELMFLLVGWHYVKQGFGVLMVLSARRGATFLPRERVVLLTHALAAWGFAWASPASASREQLEKGVVYWSVPRPPWLELATGLVLAASTIALVVTLAQKRLREGRLPPVGPLLAYVVSLWVWTIASSVDPLMLYVIPALHSVQYLYVVWLLKRNQARAEEAPPTFGKPVRLRLATLAAASIGLGWLLFRGVPGFLDDAPALRPHGLGQTPYLAALFLVVNIHHYFMDHVIWRRDEPLTRYLRDPEG